MIVGDKKHESARPASDVSLAGGVLLRAAVAVILCYLVYIAISIIFKGVFRPVDGYKLVTTDEKGIVVSEIVVRRDDPSTWIDGDYDYEPKMDENQRKYWTYAEMPPAALGAQYAVTSVFMLLLLALFPYKAMWDRGSKDRNLVQYGHATENKLRGFKVGLLANIPAAVLYLCVWVSKWIADGYAADIQAAPAFVRIFSQISAQVYHMCNLPFMPIMNSIEGIPAQYSFQIPAWALAIYVLILFYIPFVCWFGYTLGYREFSIKEHFIYKKQPKKK